jgi:hypothetical protein
MAKILFHIVNALSVLNSMAIIFDDTCTRAIHKHVFQVRAHHFQFTSAGTGRTVLTGAKTFTGATNI